MKTPPINQSTGPYCLSGPGPAPAWLWRGNKGRLSPGECFQARPTAATADRPALAATLGPSRAEHSSRHVSRACLPASPLKPSKTWSSPRASPPRPRGPTWTPTGDAKARDIWRLSRARCQHGTGLKSFPTRRRLCCDGEGAARGEGPAPPGTPGDNRLSACRGRHLGTGPAGARGPERPPSPCHPAPGPTQGQKQLQLSVLGARGSGWGAVGGSRGGQGPPGRGPGGAVQGRTLTRTVESHWWYSLSLPAETGTAVMKEGPCPLRAPEQPCRLATGGTHAPKGLAVARTKTSPEPEGRPDPQQPLHPWPGRGVPPSLLVACLRVPPSPTPTALCGGLQLQGPHCSEVPAGPEIAGSAQGCPGLPLLGGPQRLPRSPHQQGGSSQSEAGPPAPTPRASCRFVWAGRLPRSPCSPPPQGGSPGAQECEGPCTCSQNQFLDTPR